jgi:hypothetical protein
MLPGQSTIIIIKIKSWQEKTTEEKPFIGPKASTPEGSTGGYLQADSQSELNNLLVQSQ